MWRAFLLIALAAFVAGVPFNDDPTIVDTPLGQIKGIATPEFRQFVGIPYAQPPIDSLRFRPALPVQAWPGVKDATTVGAACLQDLDIHSSEDCLFLNVWTPANQSSELLPVMFWIHGGSFVVGSGGQYNSSRLVQEESAVIVVTINYRLGPLGFLASEELKAEDPSFPSTGGCNGIGDQILALKWVQANIKSFGGDPSQVTIFGESAGSLSVCALLTSELAKGLYVNAIMESGSCVGPWGPGPTAYGEAASDAFMKQAKVSSVAELRKVGDLKFLLSTKAWKVTPSVDGIILPQEPRAILEAKNSSMPDNVRIVLGSNSQDSLYAPPYYNGPWPMDAVALAFELGLWFSPSLLPSILAMYPPPFGVRKEEQTYVDINRDLCVRCPTQWMADLLTQQPINASVYLYQYMYNTDPLVFGAGHAAELGEVFGHRVGLFSYSETLSAAMRHYWTSSTTSAPQGDVEWPQYNNVTQPFLTLDATISAGAGYDTDRCEFWNQMRLSSTEHYEQMMLFCFQKHKI